MKSALLLAQICAILGFSFALEQADPKASHLRRPLRTSGQSAKYVLPRQSSECEVSTDEPCADGVGCCPDASQCSNEDGIGTCEGVGCGPDPVSCGIGFCCPSGYYCDVFQCAVSGGGSGVGGDNAGYGPYDLPSISVPDLSFSIPSITVPDLSPTTFSIPDFSDPLLSFSIPDLPNISDLDSSLSDILNSILPTSHIGYTPHYTYTPKVTATAPTAGGVTPAGNTPVMQPPPALSAAEPPLGLNAMEKIVAVIAVALSMASLLA